MKERHSCEHLKNCTDDLVHARRMHSISRVGDCKANGLVTVLGDVTALQIIRACNYAGFHMPTTTMSALPDKVVSQNRLMNALDEVQRAISSFLCSRPVSILVDGNTRMRADGFRRAINCSSSSLGRQFYRLAKDLFVLKPNPTLCMMQRGVRDIVRTLLLLWEACGTYQTSLTAMESKSQVQPLTSVRSLSKFVSANPSICGSAIVGRALKYVRDGSASLRETQLALVLGLPRRYGGYNLGLPVMNFGVEASPEARAIGGRKAYYCDLCWPEHRIDVEYQSDKEHAGEKMRIKDSRRTNALKSMGWNVFTVTNNEIRSVSTLEALSDSLRRAMGKRSRRFDSEFRVKNLLLHRHLGIVDDGRDYQSFS